jgi:hypothetical protein
MNLEELEKPIQDIISLVEKIDERYREKCFEILLNAYLRTELKLPPKPEIGERETEESAEGFMIPIDVRAFLQQYNIPEETLQKLFLMDKNEIRPIYTLTTTRKSAAQMQMALLTALENAIGGPGEKFEFSVEIVRQRCKDRLVYDQPNFKAHFKNNKKLFKSLDEEEHVELSAEGLTELAEVISTVTKK